ncbi:MAG: hypothetical protein KatS3mg104_0497 [Phycisphaerae bacterium]|jgi:hypothetical protein|nr:MAG: hypothetical protein KatS3mg104_0497 [Phycisphaerae bacterium]
MKLVSKLALAALVTGPTVALAEKPNTGALEFSGGFDVASAYYFRGYLQENAGLIIQPYFNVAFTAVESDDFTLGVNLGTWNSIHTENTASDGNGAGAWYENDITLELPISFGKFTVTPLYYLYQYPNGAFETIQEIGLTISYDDTGLIADDFALAPYIGIYHEFDDGNGTEDTYAEIGIGPSWTPPAVGGYEIPALTFPIALGLSLNDYYTDSEGDNALLGYGSVGVTTSFPLPVPEKWGAWSVNVGGYYQYLFADSAEAANNDSQHVFYGTIGMSFVY